MNTNDRPLLDVRNGAESQTWVMQFPPVNALSPEFLAALDASLTDAVSNSAVSAVVLTSGLKVFSAGGDATWMSHVLAADGPQGLLEKFSLTMESFRELCLRIRQSPLLVIAALNGHTLAGGLELAAACDLRFSADDDRIQIGVPEMDLFGAMPSGGGGAQFLTRLMGPSRALQFVLDAKPVSPRVALEMGLVDRLCATEKLVQEAEAFASAVAKKAGRIGVAAAKKAILGGAELPLFEALEFDRALHWDSMRRGNFLEGVQDFVKRFGAKNA